MCMHYTECLSVNIVSAFAKNSLSWPRHAGTYVYVYVCMHYTECLSVDIVGARVCEE